MRSFEEFKNELYNGTAPKGMYTSVSENNENIILEITDEYWDLIYTDAERLEKIKDEVFDIFKLIYGVMWW